MQLGDVVRIEGKKIFCPIVTLAKEERVIILVGMIHLASVGFFSSIRSRLETYEECGFRVLYEIIDPHLTLGFGTRKEQRFQKKCRKAHKKLIKKLETRGLAYQGKHIRIRSAWFPVDFTIEDWQAVGFSIIQPTKQKVESMRRCAAHPERIIEQFCDKLCDPSLVFPKLEVVVNKRDRVAATKIVSHAMHSDIVSIWGAAHLPGLSDLLVNEGYEVRSTKWMCALDLSKLKAERD